MNKWRYVIGAGIKKKKKDLWTEEWENTIGHQYLSCSQLNRMWDFFFPPSTREKWSCCKTNCTGFSAPAKLDWHNGGGEAPRHATHTHTLAILAHSSQVGGDRGNVVRHQSSRWPRPRNLQVHRSSVPLQRNTWKRVSPASLSLGSNRSEDNYRYGDLCNCTRVSMWQIFPVQRPESRGNATLLGLKYSLNSGISSHTTLLKSYRLREQFMSFEKL